MDEQGENFMTRSTRRRVWTAGSALGLALTTALALIGPIATPAGASNPKLYAKPAGSGTTCGKTTECTLSEALIKALPGTTIILRSGNYNEQPTISKANLTIQGPSDHSAVLRKVNATQNATTPNIVGPPAYASGPMTALVNVTAAGTGFTLDNVAINGSVANLPSATRFSAIYVRSSVATFENITTSSIYPGTGPDGNQQGTIVDVRTDTSSTSNVTISKSTLAGYNKTGVVCNFPGTTCTVDKTTVTGAGAINYVAQNGVQISREAVGTISNSTITGNNYTPSPQASGILIYNAGSGVTITKNTVSGNDNNIYAYQDGNDPGTSANVQITKNTSSGSTAYDDIAVADVTGANIDGNIANNGHAVTGFGIGLYGAHNSTVHKNKVNNSATDGIYVGGPGNINATSTGNSVTSNKVFNSANVGIHADTSAVTNSFDKNTTKNSAVWDIQDDGTGNQWNTEHCTTHASSQPLGDC